MEGNLTLSKERDGGARNDGGDSQSRQAPVVFVVVASGERIRSLFGGRTTLQSWKWETSREGN